MATAAPKTVGIIGAAIAGPTLALQILSHPVLKRAFRPILIDQAPSSGRDDEKHRAGATVSLFANGLYPLYQLGLKDAIEKHGYEYGALSVWGCDLNGSYKQLNSQPNAMWSSDLQTGVMYFERYALQSLLLDKLRTLGGEEVSWGKRAVEYRALDNAKTRISFTDGDVLDVDLLVGADGAYSAVRRFILDQRNPATAEKRWMPDSMKITGFYGVSEGKKAKDAIAEFADSHCVWLDRGTLATGPLRNGRIRWDLLLPEDKPPTTYALHDKSSGDLGADAEPWQASIIPSPYAFESTVDILRQHSKVFHPYAGNLEALLNSADRIIRSPLRQRAWDQSEIQWGNAVLVGDAARLMLPTSGQGSGFAVEDATVLAGQLLKYASSPVDSNEALREALREYARQRQPRSTLMARTAEWVGKMGMGSNFYWRFMRSAVSWMKPRAPVKDTKQKDPWPMDGRFKVGK